MAKCEICGKGPLSGNNVSFSQKKTKRKFKPNIQRATLYVNGKKVRKNLCTRCLKTWLNVVWMTVICPNYLMNRSAKAGLFLLGFCQNLTGLVSLSDNGF